MILRFIFISLGYAWSSLMLQRTGHHHPKLLERSMRYQHFEREWRSFMGEPL